MRRWYGDPLIRQEANIVERYVGRYFRGAESKGISEKAFFAVAQSAFGADLVNNRLEIGPNRYELPSAGCFFGYPHGAAYSSCICHGDLNSNNVTWCSRGEMIKRYSLTSKRPAADTFSKIL